MIEVGVLRPEVSLALPIACILPRQYRPSVELLRTAVSHMPNKLSLSERILQSSPSRTLLVCAIACPAARTRDENHPKTDSDNQDYLTWVRASWFP